MRALELLRLKSGHVGEVSPDVSREEVKMDQKIFPEFRLKGFNSSPGQLFSDCLAGEFENL